LPSLMQLCFSWFLWPFPHPVHRIGWCFPNVTNYIFTKIYPLNGICRQFAKIQCYMFRPYWVILRKHIYWKKVLLHLFASSRWIVINMSYFASCLRPLCCWGWATHSTVCASCVDLQSLCLP
jgi:hypothetical protein